MSMERITVSMHSKDVDLFERGRADAGMSKSAYIRLLIAEHEERVPNFWKHKPLIAAISELNTSIAKLIISDKISDQDKLYLYEKLDELKKLLKTQMQS